MKPGYKSSELGATVAVALLAALNRRLGLEISDDVLMALAGLAATYVAGRSWAKKGAEAATP